MHPESGTAFQRGCIAAIINAHGCCILTKAHHVGPHDESLPLSSFVCDICTYSKRVTGWLRMRENAIANSSYRPIFDNSVSVDVKLWA